MSEDLIDRLRAVAEEVLGGIDATCVFCAGSYLERRATENSDIDLIVITEGLNEVLPQAGNYVLGRGLAVRRGLFKRDNKQIDTEYWIRGDLEHFLKSLEDFSGQPMVEYPVELIRLVHRVSVGAPIIGESYFQWIQSLDPLRRLADRLVVTHLFDCKSKLEDYADWANHVPDRGTHILARMALDHAVDAYLALRHRINPNPKWRLCELQDVDPELAADYYSLAEGATTSSADTQRRALLASTVAACTEIALPYQRLSRVRASSRSGRAPEGQRDAYLREPASYLGKAADGGLLLRVVSGTTWEVDLSGALVWILCDGTLDFDEMTGSIRGLCSVGRELRDQVQGALMDFERRGIARKVRIGAASS